MNKTISIIMLSGLLLSAAAMNSANAACTHDGYCDRPIQMGVSIGNTPSLPFIYTGTAGMRVFPWSNPGLKLILSNNHVLGAVGPDLCPNTADGYPPPLTWALQPGTLDLGFDPGNDPTYLAGVVLRFIPIDFSLGASNVVDAAVAITTTSLASSSILGLGQPNPALGTATPGMPITKSGRTTGVTTSTVQSVNSTVTVSYGGTCGSARFVNQVITGGDLGDSGDSGSVVLETATNTPVGLYFAGSATTGVMNPILNVYLTLKVFVDSATPANIDSEKDLMALAALQADPRIEALKPVQARHENAILAIRGVRGIGIGLDKSGTEPAFIVYAEKLTNRLRSRLPASIEGTKVRLVESGNIVAH
jgi:hypothetical protein